MTEHPVLAGALARNAACHQCRTRKRKCDGVRPVCTPCRNPLRRSKAPLTECSWDTDAPLRPLDPMNHGPHPHAEPDWDMESTRSRSGDRALHPRQREGLRDADFVKRRKETLSSSPSSQYHELVEERQTWTGGRPDGRRGGAERLPPLTELMWPDWPPDLPSLTAMQHIANVFFDKVPLVPKMIRRQKLMSNLRLPASHPQFPARSLLHAIIAISTVFMPPHAGSSPQFASVYTRARGREETVDDFAPRTRSSGSTRDSGDGFQDWHRTKALARLAEQQEAFVKLVEGLQSYIIITQLDLFTAKCWPYWQEAGGCIRLAIPFQLNESPNQPNTVFRRMMNQFIPPASTPEDQAERDRTWWMAWLMAQQSTLPSYMPPSIPDKDVTVELPVTQALYEAGRGDLTGCQTFQSPDLFSYHPPRHVDGFPLLVKAMKVNSDIINFFRDFGRADHLVESYIAHPRVAQLRSDISAMRRTLPTSLRLPMSAMTIDNEMLSAMWLVHSADGVLGEPTIMHDWRSELASSSLRGMQTCLKLLLDIIATGYDITLLSTLSFTVWFTCTRIMCRFIEAATCSGDLTAAAIFSRDCQIFRDAVDKYGIRMEIGRKQLERVDALLQAQQHAVNITDFKSSCIQDMTDAVNRGALSLEPDDSPEGSAAAVSLSAMPASASASSNAASTSISPPSGSEGNKDWGEAWVEAAGLDVAAAL